MPPVPEGFEPLSRRSPFSELLGPVYNRTAEDGSIVLGLYAQAKHGNTRGIVHGGMISSLADIALGYNAAFNGGDPIPLVTASLTVDYAGSAQVGDWITVVTDVQKVGRSMAFANCFFYVKEQRIARASAVFKVLDT